MVGLAHRHFSCGCEPRAAQVRRVSSKEQELVDLGNSMAAKEREQSFVVNRFTQRIPCVLNLVTIIAECIEAKESDSEQLNWQLLVSCVSKAYFPQTLDYYHA